MTGSEFAFLALGLALGVAVGAALIEVLRARPPSPREVRVTVAPGSIPARSVTLATDPFAAVVDGPAPFGPGDRRSQDRPGDAAPVTTRTDVPSATRAEPARYAGIAIRPEPDPTLRALRPAAIASIAVTGRGAVSPDTDGTRPMAGVAMAGPSGPAVALAERPDALVGAAGAPGRVASADAPGPADDAGAPGPHEATGRAATLVANGARSCAELRAIAEDRCAVAARAQEAAESAAQASREAQRAYDDHLSHADAAAAIADPRAVRAAKETAQAQYRAAHGSATTREGLESAARDWLAEINRINAAARDGAARADRERAAANALVPVIERLSVEADAARISAEAAARACIDARQAVADCEEATRPRPVAPPPPPAPEERYPEEEPELTGGGPGETPWDQDPRIMRLLRGDRRALLATVGDLAGDDRTEQRRWQLAVTGLVDALVSQAIEASMVDVPDEPSFWEPFTRSQRRDIVAALASLGYRFDGLGGFADGRAPSQRDLSLAVGYAGLDPMRIRHWPTEAEMAGLFAGTTVAADEYLVATAGGLTLSEMVDLLGRRADGLTDLWNEWGRVRPCLLAVD